MKNKKNWDPCESRHVERCMAWDLCRRWWLPRARFIRFGSHEEGEKFRLGFE